MLHVGLCSAALRASASGQGQFERLSIVKRTLLLCCHETFDGNEASLKIKRAAKRSTARLGAHQAWLRKFRSRWRWMIRSVLLKLPARPALSERRSTVASLLHQDSVARSQQELQARTRRSKR